MKKDDLRVVKTELAIKKAFAELIKEKNFTDIKIQDIADKAIINRNTFYLHYSSKEELLSEIIDNATKYTKKLFFIAKPNKIDYEMIFMLISRLIDASNSFKYIIRALMKDSTMLHIFTNFKKVIYDSFLELIDRDRFRSEISLEFIISGIYGVLEKWILGDNLQRDEIVSECSRLCMSCLT